MLDIYNHAVAHNVNGGLPQNAGGQKVKDEFALLIYNGVAGVVSALIAADDIIIRREQINHSALAFVAPVCSYNCC